MSTPLGQSPLRVSIIGASGIGKNHARWFHQHSCEICAFVGSSPESIERTRQILQNGFGFSGQGYTKTQEMLAQEKPDVVCVSSPPPLHYRQTLACLEAGAHVLCEKPLVFDEDKSREELNAQADEMVARAGQARVLLGTQMQYAMAAPQIMQMAGAELAGLRSFEMVMETKNIKDKRSHDQIWVDLAPHPLSVLQKAALHGVLEPHSIQCRIAERETTAQFNLRRANGTTIECRIVTRFDPAATPPQRRFIFDGYAVDYSGRNNADGEFRSFLSNAETEKELPDFVDLLIGNFTAACQGETELFVTGQDGAQNIDWVLQILAAGTRV